MQKTRLNEIVQRSESGPYSKEADFEKAVVQRVQELVRQYGLKFERQTPIPADPDLADRLYQAGLELFVELGAYNMSTQRRITFSRAEVEQAVAAAPGAVRLGTGKDAVMMRQRGAKNDAPCVVHSGPTGTPCSERYHPLILQSCTQEPLIDCLGAGSVSTYMGEAIISGTPLEVLGVQRDANAAREATRRAGRPGMHINDVASPLTCAGKIATIHPEWGLRPSDGLLVSQMVELKTNYDQLSRAAHLQSVGIHIVDLMTPLVGGLGGGAPGTAVIAVACHLLGVLLYAPSYHIHGHMHLLESTSTDRMGLWIYAMSGQALARNTPILTTSAIYTQAGLGTEQVLWEIAAGAVAATVGGMHHNGVGATGGASQDHTSGLEQRFFAQVAHASLGLSLQDANELVLRLLDRYEATHMRGAPAGQPFAEIYNSETLEPSEAWLTHYSNVCHELQTMGLDVDNGWKKALLKRTLTTE
jgi:methylamine--corrinoid protein Co-methyltransferase